MSDEWKPHSDTKCSTFSLMFGSYIAGEEHNLHVLCTRFSRT